MISSSGTLNVVAFTLAIVTASGFVAVPAPPTPTKCSRLRCSVHEEGQTASPNLTAVDFYSGIGGLRVALGVAQDAAGSRSRKASSVTVVESYDINAVANLVYELNFPGKRVARRSIEHLSLKDLNGIADVWLLSPPCQPFCRVGKRMDTEDTRSVSFMHLLSILESVADPPSHLFLENVQGFEGSRAHEGLLQILCARGYHVEQYLLSPVQLGIPNTRLRYYCLATRHTDGEGHIAAMEESMPFPAEAASSTPDSETRVPRKTLSEFLDASLDGNAAIPLLLSPKAAGHANSSLRFDVVTLRSNETTTFTKGYGKHAGRAGPVILLSADGTRKASEEDLGRFPEGIELGTAGREVRWFSDREMLRLHGFPETFAFPPDLTLRQRFGLIGNSVSVYVVSVLLRQLLFEGTKVGRAVAAEIVTNECAPVLSSPQVAT